MKKTFMCVSVLAFAALSYVSHAASKTAPAVKVVAPRAAAPKTMAPKADMTRDLATQYARSLDLLLTNISRPDSARGSVVAAPSYTTPNYFFHWIRDSALTMDTLVQISRTDSTSRDRLRPIIKDYATFSRGNQMTSNRSGGLGEPKFNMDGSAFSGEWGRPQNDGPALRAITLIHFANLLLDDGDQEGYVRAALYDGKIPTNTVIKADLEYTAYHWDAPCFDIWEETYGQHFYNAIVSRRAMIEGARLADRLGDGGAAAYYRAQIPGLEKKIETFWNDSRGIFEVSHYMIQTRTHKDGIDSAVILGALHGDSQDGYLGAADDRIISTAYTIMQSFVDIYDINKNTNVGTAIGRYPEDVYDGANGGEGNPWFLTTLAYSEFCNRSRVAFEHLGHIQITARNLNFINFALQGQMTVHVGDYFNRDSKEFGQISSGLTQVGDRFFNTILLHRAADGSMSEQFSRHNGFMLSAPNLSWSHASFLTAKIWRDTP